MAYCERAKTTARHRTPTRPQSGSHEETKNQKQNPQLGRASCKTHPSPSTDGTASHCIFSPALQVLLTGHNTFPILSPSIALSCHLTQCADYHNPAALMYTLTRDSTSPPRVSVLAPLSFSLSRLSFQFYPTSSGSARSRRPVRRAVRKWAMEG